MPMKLGNCAVLHRLDIYCMVIRYDAFMTGVVFIRALHALKIDRTDISGLKDSSGKLCAHSNQLHLMRIESTLKLPGPNIGPLRPDMLYVTSVPAAAKNWHIVKMVQAVVSTPPESSPPRISVNWLNDNSV